MRRILSLDDAIVMRMMNRQFTLANHPMDSFVNGKTIRSSGPIKVIGVGGCGINMAQHLIKTDVNEVDVLCANTDIESLLKMPPRQRIQLGTSGLGSRRNRERARMSALPSLDLVRQAISGTRILFIAAGMGGGTGSAVAPLIAQLAREMGIVTVGVVVTPFKFEGTRSRTNSELALTQMDTCTNMLIVVSNERILEVLDDRVSQEQAFSVVNDVLKNAVHALTAIYAVFPTSSEASDDVSKTWVSGRALAAMATATGPHRVSNAVKRSFECALLEDRDLRTAKMIVVVLISAKGSLLPHEISHARNVVLDHVSADTNFALRLDCDNTLEDQVRAAILVTGIEPCTARS